MYPRYQLSLDTVWNSLMAGAREDLMVKIWDGAGPGGGVVAVLCWGSWLQDHMALLGSCIIYCGITPSQCSIKQLYKQ